MLKDGISVAVKEFISISFEKAEVNDLITNDPSFHHLQFFDPGAIFTADMDSLQIAKVMSMITNLQSTVDKLAKKPSGGSGLTNQMVERFEKVKFFNYLTKSMRKSSLKEIFSCKNS